MSSRQPISNPHNNKYSCNIHDFKKVLQQINFNNCQLQLLKNLTGVNSVTKVDNQGLYSLVDTKKYQEIVTEITTSKQNNKKATELLMATNDKNVELTTILNLKEQLISKMKIDYDNFLKQIKQLKNIIFKKEQEIHEKNQQIESVMLMTKKYELELIHGKEQSLALTNKIHEISRRQYKQCNKSIQTQCYANKAEEYEISTLPFKALSQKMISQELSEQQRNIHDETQIIRIFDQKLQEFCQLLEHQVQVIQQQYLDLQELRKENADYQLTNQKLLQENSQIKSHENQLDIWKKQIHHFLAHLEENLLETENFKSSHYNQEESQYRNNPMDLLERQKDKILDLYTKYAVLKASIKSVDKMMNGEGDVAEDSPVGSMLKLSQKIKNIVRGLVLEVDLM